MSEQVEAPDLRSARALVEPVRRELVEAFPAEMRRVVGYHLGWWDADLTPVRAGGKDLRSALVLAAARAVGEVAGPRPPTLRAAAAVECVHDFSLLHDDVMDGDRLRRGRPAAWTVFGPGRAVLAGDLLLAAASELLADGPGHPVLAAAVTELCRGQARDLEFESRQDVSLDEALAMAEAKTGALLGCACELGALAGGGSAGQAAALRRFGREAGVAFQLVDDLLGIWGVPAVTGKPVFADLAARKKSLPVVAALTSGTAAGDALAAIYRSSRVPGADAARLIELAGARAWAAGEAARRVSGALTALDRAGAHSTELASLAHLITARSH
ncbi:polyprenyl synthetase family protein [Actinocorallia longicatena]|uniref:Family 2 encapsulin nanocompartment cargo protein polyprenyl transferase n=1 Tax=Actinocorallia longicatena TaxID=111803 RepID=A0ABP6QMC3_9ACTN